MDDVAIEDGPSRMKLNTISSDGGADTQCLVPRWEFAVPVARPEIKKFLTGEQLDWSLVQADYGECAVAYAKFHTSPSNSPGNHPYAGPHAYQNYPDPCSAHDELVNLLREFQALNKFDILPMGLLIHGAFDWLRCLREDVHDGGMVMENFPKPDKRRLKLVSLPEYLVYHGVNLCFYVSTDLVTFLNTNWFAASCPTNRKFKFISLPDYFVHHGVNLRFCVSIDLVTFLSTSRFAATCPTNRKFKFISLPDYFVYHGVNLRFCVLIDLVTFLSTSRFAASCVRFDLEHADHVRKMASHGDGNQPQGIDMIEELLADAMTIRPAGNMGDNNFMYELISRYGHVDMGPIFPSDILGTAIRPKILFPSMWSARPSATRPTCSS
ncbi:hypothetical protein F4780DRAFT_744748 [Xylariomycetidae sp. FL0641]|nr:hypothetical protein F4780DRAFT_744748 [Xylariomycetidae sp. FL0641]